MRSLSPGVPLEPKLPRSALPFPAPHPNPSIPPHATHEPPFPIPPFFTTDPLMFWLFNVVVASFAVIPGAASATSIAAGVIYGTPVGVALVSTSCAVGAGVSFLIARYAARLLVERRHGRFEMVEAHHSLQLPRRRQ